MKLPRLRMSTAWGVTGVTQLDRRREPRILVECLDRPVCARLIAGDRLQRVGGLSVDDHLRVVSAQCRGGTRATRHADCNEESGCGRNRRFMSVNPPLRLTRQHRDSRAAAVGKGGVTRNCWRHPLLCRKCCTYGSSHRSNCAIQVIEALTGNPGVAHLVVHRDAALDPPGDEITADIARESANDVIEALKAMGVKERGAITLDVVDTVLVDAGVPRRGEGRRRPRRRGGLGRTGRPDPRGVHAQRHLPDVPVPGVPDRRGRRRHRLAGHRGRRDGGRAGIRARWPRWRSRWCGARRTWPAAPRWRCWSASRSPCWSPRSACSPARPSAGSKSDEHPRAERGGLHLPGRPAVVRRRAVRGRGRDAVVGVGQVGRPGRRLHLGDDGARGGLRRRRRDGGGLGYRAESAAQLAVNLLGIVLAGGVVLWVRGVADRRHWHHDRLSARCAAPSRCDGISGWASRWRWSIAPATRSTGWWRCTRTSSACARRHIRVPRSRPTRCRSSPPTTSSTGSRTHSAISSPGWSSRTGRAA